MIDTARELGYEAIQWDCDSLDWKGLGVDDMRQRIQRSLNPGSIMLFHNDTKSTAKALPQIITDLQEDGYQIVPVGELILSGETHIDHTGRQFAD